MENKYEMRLQEVIKQYDQKVHPIFSIIERTPISLDIAQNLARKYYPVNLAFCKFLAAAISHVDNEDTRMLLVENLYEEHGKLDLKKAHTELFRVFMRSVKINPEEYKQPAKKSAEEKIISVYNKFCYEGPDYKGLAVLFAFEKLFSPLCTSLARKLKESIIAKNEDFVFFDVHGEADIVHAQKLKESLLASIHTKEELEGALILVKEGADLLCSLIEEIYNGK
jgi:pyrroloquinoline quinone (PQQ) biosynthesis protein C